MKTEFVDYDKSEHRHTETTRKAADIRIGRSPVKRIVDHYKERLSCKWALVGTYRDRDGMRHDIFFRVVYTPEEAVEAVKERVEKYSPDPAGLYYTPSGDGDLSERVRVVVFYYVGTPDEAMDVDDRIRDACFTAKRCNLFLDYMQKTAEEAQKRAVEPRKEEGRTE